LNQEFTPGIRRTGILARARGRLSGLLAPGQAPASPPLLAVVIPLEGEAGNRAAAMQLELHARYRGAAVPDSWPHVSIKLGFAGPDPARVAEWLREVAHDTPPFRIGLRGLDAFDEGILFIDVAADGGLESLRGRVLRDLRERFGVAAHPVEGEGFRFHVTLAHGLRGGDFAAAGEGIPARRFDEAFTARHLELLCHAGSHWITLARQPLGLDMTSQNDDSRR
jgi:2'-5' RNA ligase